jgi:CHAT domain-containing protein/Tfp pilus assembly protein PilF
MRIWARRKTPICLQPFPAPETAKPIRNNGLRVFAAIATLLLATCSGYATETIDSLASKGKPEQALRLADKALAQQPVSSSVYWQLALRKAELLEQLNRRDAALLWLAKLRPGTAPAEIGTLLIREQATIETALGKFQDSDRHLREAIDLAEHSGQTKMAAKLEISRAYVLLQLDRLEEARNCLSAAKQYGRKSGDHSLDAYILHYQGQLQEANNQIEDAIRAVEESLRIFRQAKQNGLAANVVFTLARCYYLVGRSDRSLALYQDALALADPDDRHLVLGHLGVMFREQGDYLKATDYFKQAAQLAKGRKRDFEAKWLNNLAGVLIDQRQWAEAERYNSEAREVEKQIDGSQERAATFVNAGLIETHKGNYGAAEQALRHVAAPSAESDPHVLEAYGALSQVYIRAKKPDAAKAEFETALTLADRKRANLHEDENKLAYLSSLTDLNRQYVDFLMDRGDHVGAFAVAESSRGRLLRERLNLPHFQLHSHTIAEYQTAARASGTTLLAYWIGPEHSYLWAISGTDFERYRLPAEPEIRHLIERYQRVVEGSAPKPEDTAAGEQLYNLLLARCSGVLKKGGKYVIVPDGPLYGLNFETLPVPGEHPHYWIEDATVAVAPSLDLLLARHAARRHGGPLLLVGDANEWNPEFPKLLYARKEIEGIESGYTDGARTVLAGASATPAAYQKAQPAQFAYIHFATHASANKNAPFESAIILSKDNGSGKLSVKDVLGSRLNAELVTISACHSAGARTYWGEGLVGFTWAFLQSGAHAVIAGLWDVSDYASPRLMHDLYAGLAASRSPAEALRQAKLQLIAGGKYASPYYWGALQLYKGAL